MSSLEAGDRRRLLAAGLTSIAALPFLLGGQGKGTSTGVATIGQGAVIAGALDTSSEPVAAGIDTPVAEGDPTPGFLFGPPPATNPSEIVVVVPTSGPTNMFEGTATYEHFGNFNAAAPCTFAGAPEGTELIVLDLDNGRSLWCTVVGPPAASARADLVLDSVEFEALADLGQSPVHVRLSW